MSIPESSPTPSGPNRPLRRFERWLETAVHRPSAVWWIVLATAIENTLVPLTIEPIVVPLMAVYRDRIIPFAAAMATGSVLGGVAMYVLGVAVAAGAAGWLEGLAGTDAASEFVAELEESGFWTIFVFAISPLPFQVATLGAGLAGFPFASFLVAIALGRSLLYAGFAVAVAVLGTAVRTHIERHKVTALVTCTIMALIVIVAIIRSS